MTKNYEKLDSWKNIEKWPHGGPQTTLIFGAFFVIFAKWKKNAEKNMFFEKSIFNDFLDAKKVAPRSHRNQWQLSLQGPGAPWGTRGNNTTNSDSLHL